tara:strand:- start:1951 stop:2334 length:384 start_codon:yes stop_codon:yes gene_type:complete
MYRLEKNTSDYWPFIRELRNDPRVKKGFIQQKEISREDHSMYMQAFGDNFYICLDNTGPIGYIGVIHNDIRVATHPEHQGKGVAKFMVTEIIKRHPDAFAKVKIENEASLRLFESCGFEKKYFVLER